MTGASNDLTNVRVEAKDALEAAGVRAFTVVPAVVAPPAVWVAPGDPYVTFEGASFGGGRIVRLSLVVVVASGTGDTQAAALDDLVLQVCDAVDDSEELVLGDVGQPGQVSLNNGQHLACSIAVTREIHRPRS